MTRTSQSTVWDAATVAAGLALLFLTFHAYRSWNLSHRAQALSSLSAPQATLRVESDKAVLATQPDDLDAMTDLAVSYYQKGHDSYIDGLNALEKARALGATNEALFFYAGVMYGALGLPDYAANEFAKYLRHYPDDYETMVRLANVNVTQNKVDEALQLYEKALHYWPKDPTAWFNYAVVNIKKGNIDVAQVALAHVQKLAGALPLGGHFEEGELARLKGLDDAAIASYQAELSIHPDYIPALEALEALQKRKNLWKEAQQTHRKLQEQRHPARTADGVPGVSSTDGQKS